MAAEDGRPAAAFERERAALAAVRHPGLVTLLSSAVEADGTGVLTTARVEGPTLRQALRDGPFAPGAACAVLVALLETLEALHAGGYLHGDLKPENVALAAGGRPVLLDLGLALAPGAFWHASGAGTPDYMAPEQVRRERVDARTDSYAAGALLYELLTGQPPFVGSTAAQLRGRQLISTPVPPGLVLGDGAIAEELSALVLRALAKEPARRPTPAELRAALAPFAGAANGLT